MRLRASHGGAGMIVLGSMVIAANWCSAQSRPEVTLEEVLALVGHGNYVVQESRLLRSAADADGLVTKGAFDWSAHATVVGEYQAVPRTMNVVRSTDGVVSRFYEASIRRTFPSGVRLEPFVRAAAGPGEISSAVAGLAVRMPLMQAGRSNPATAQARSARRRIKAAEFRHLYALSEQLQQASSAFWDVVEAEMRAKILAEAEARAYELLEMMQRLVKAGERPRAEVNQMEAYVADRIAVRIGSEHQLFAARERLNALVGSEDQSVFDRPVVHWLPEPDTATMNGSGAAQATALDQRWDLLAAQEDQMAASELLRGARVASRPQFDMDVAAMHPLSSSGASVPAVGEGSVTVGLTLARPLANYAGAGLIAQHESAAQQQTVRLEAIRRQAEASTRIARDARETAVREVVSADAAMAAHELTVEQEFVRLANGFATVLDVTVAEERLTSSRISALAARARYARALVRDAHERGDIVHSEEERPEARSARILAR